MPTYELSLVVKHGLKRPELVTAVKRAGETIIGNGGYVRNLEFLGHRNLPQRQKANNEYHTKGSYFLLKVDLPIQEVDTFKGFAKRDATILRYDFIRPEEVNEPHCTLEDEMKIPAERPSVQAMIAVGRKRPTYRNFFKPRTGLDFYPLYK